MTDAITLDGHRAVGDLPIIRWTQLEGVMLELADSETKRLMVRHLIEGLRKQSGYLPVEETLREILCIGFALMDGDFRPGPTRPLPA
jgi:hypothetical protein